MTLISWNDTSTNDNNEDDNTLSDDDEDEDVWYRGKPLYRRWELNENSTRYDKLAAAPSDEDLHQFWSAWSGIAFLVVVFTMIVFLGILSNRRTRQNPFNLYLIFLMIPDIVFSLCCGLTCMLNAIKGEYWSAWMCNFQQWYCVFGIGANAWLNAVIAHQIYTMLKYGHQRRRYERPPQRQVTLHAIVVYAYAAFLGTWGLITVKDDDSNKGHNYDGDNYDGDHRHRPSHWPMYSGTISGLACLPLEADRASSLFFWLCFFPLFAGIPIGYVAYIFYDVWKRQLLPRTGNRRLLAVYFARIILVFLIMWIPTVIIIFLFAPFFPPSVHFAGGTWSHLQGAVSAGITLLKPDVYRAVKNMLRCKCSCCHDDDDNINKKKQGSVDDNATSRRNNERGIMINGEGTTRTISEGQLSSFSASLRQMFRTSEELSVISDNGVGVDAATIAAAYKASSAEFHSQSLPKVAEEEREPVLSSSHQEDDMEVKLETTLINKHNEKEDTSTGDDVPTSLEESCFASDIEEGPNDDDDDDDSIVHA